MPIKVLYTKLFLFFGSLYQLIVMLLLLFNMLTKEKIEISVQTLLFIFICAMPVCTINIRALNS